jgi:hypothetical protein
MNEIEKQFQAARQNLLDLTMRNQLLNFRPTKARTIRVLDEVPKEIYDLLVINEKTVEFLQKAKTQQASKARPEGQQWSKMGKMDTKVG